jgi:hypothetical protein
MVSVEDTIEPGSLEYGDRQVVSDRIKQVRAQATPQPRTPGAATEKATARLSSGPVSDKPVTSGMSVGPGSSPQMGFDAATTPEVEKLRLMAANARNPYMRHLAMNALRAMKHRSK